MPGLRLNQMNWSLSIIRLDMHVSVRVLSALPYCDDCSSCGKPAAANIGAFLELT
jgi:transposase